MHVGEDGPDHNDPFQEHDEMNESVEKQSDGKHHRPLRVELVLHDKCAKDGDQRHDDSAPDVEDVEASYGKP